MSQVRVLQFITPAGFYGAERWILALANNVDYDQVVCDLAVSDEGGSQDLSVLDYFPSEAGKIHKLPMRGRFDWRVVRELCRIIGERRIDVIHTHGYKSDILGVIAAKRMGIACVSTPHGFPNNMNFKLATFVRMGTFALRYFDTVAPLSDELVADMRRIHVPVKKTRFIRNGVDLKEIDQAMADIKHVDRGSEWKQQTTFTIGFIGQMIDRKGVPELLAVFDRLYEKYPHLRLVLVGDGDKRLELEAQAANLASRDAINFLGFRIDRLELLSQFDLFVMTSSLEGIPRCMMEAMSVGVPVVGYDIPGVDQLIEHDVTGLLAPLGDRDALASCCERVINNPLSAKAWTSAAREKIDREYSAARMAREYEALFRELRDHRRLAAQPDRRPG
ncbi:glycosyltransferase [Mangrovitalea sediminis]|uniref:glycosyltransferase n=1 Tax=Mangrovitalea sediminis TaxID=1982043 RepID=UPI000BE4E917|nr:glycosyltransferase [Mangrovitalea sediminis]